MELGQEGLHADAAGRELTRARQSLRIAGIGSWEVDLRSLEFVWDETCRELHGFGDHAPGNYDEIWANVHPDDAVQIRERIRSAMAGENKGLYRLRLRMLHKDGSAQRWLQVRGQVGFDETGVATRIVGTAQDMTELLDARSGAGDAEQLARLAIEAAGAGSFRIIVATGEFFHTPTLKRIFTGSAEGRLLHSEFLRYIHPDDQPIRQRAQELALQTGQLSYEIRVIWDDGSVHWMRATGTYEYDASGSPVALSGIMEDITEYMTARIAIERSERLSRSVFENSPVAKIITVGEDLRIEALNKRMIEILGVPAETLIGRGLTDAIPSLSASNLPRLMREVQQSGILVEVAEEGIDGLNPRQPGRSYFQHRHSPLRDAGGELQGVISTWIDISREVALREAEKGYQEALRASEKRFRSIIDEAPVATCLFVGPQMRVEVANAMMLRAWGKGREVIGKPLVEALPEIVGQPFPDILAQVYRTGVPYSATSGEARLEVDGVLGTYYYNFTYQPLFDEHGEVYAILDMALDVTEAVVARKRLEEAQAALLNAINLAELGTWSLDIADGIIRVSPRMLGWFGLTEEEAMLGEAVNAIIPADRERVAAAIAAACRPGAGIYSEEYTVRNKRSGQRRIIHAQGKAVTDDTGTPVRLEGTARDITLTREVQAALEQLVQQRTEELAAANEELQATNEELLVTNEEVAEANERLIHSNEELAQYAYVASHDLQEPLRKIRVFSGMLNESRDMSRHDLELLAKISGSAERMSLLIRDLLEFSRLLNSDATLQLVSLGDVAAAIRTDFELRILEKDAIVEIGPLPMIEAVALQMNQLFYNLIGNALKFVQEGVRPEIRVSAAPISDQEAAAMLGKLLPDVQYHRITVRDNGIGFEQQYTEQIFEVFKRLHGRDMYPGSGIGLALCRRIVNNHSGMLFAESAPGAGSSFHIIIPERQS